MKTIESILKKEKNELERVVNRLEKRLQNIPTGFLRIAQKVNHVEYYYKSGNKDEKEKYLKKSEIQLAKNMNKLFIQRKGNAFVLSLRR